jgi:heme-degrading monooxygenase HmoA
MYATVRTYAGATELVDALVANAGAVESLIGEIDGFKAYYLVRTGDGAVSVSVFESAAGTDASNSAAAAWIGENLPDLGVNPPQVWAGEVALSF